MCLGLESAEYQLCIHVGKGTVVTLANMRLLACITVVSAVSSIARAALVPYTLGDTTIMVESSILGHNSPLLSYLRQGMAHRRGDNTNTELLDNISSQSSDPTQEVTGEDEKLSPSVSKIEQQFASAEEFYAKPFVNEQTDALQRDTTSQEAAGGDEKQSSGSPEGQYFSSNKDFQTNPEGSLAIQVLSEKYKPTSSGRPTPITINEAGGLYFEGQRVPITVQDNTPPLYYNVHTPNFAQVSEKIHNIVTSLSPKLNDRAPGSSRHPPIRNAIPLQLHARPGDTPPSLANTEGFTGVSVKHMVPEEPSSFEDYTTNNEDLDFLLSSDPLLQSELHPKPFRHDGPSPLSSDKPVGHIWGSPSEISQHTRIHGDDEVITSKLPSSFDENFTPEQDFEPGSSSDAQTEGSEIQIRITNTNMEEPSSVETDIGILEPVVHKDDDNNKLTYEYSAANHPEVGYMLPVRLTETNTGTPIAGEWDLTPEEADSLTSLIPKGEDVTEESFNASRITEEEFTSISSIDETKTASVLDEMDTFTSTTERMITVTAGEREMETTTPIVEVDTTATVDLDSFLFTKMKELQRDEIQEAILEAEEEKDQVALDQAMEDLLYLFNSMTNENDTQTTVESEAQNWQNNSFPVTESYKESDADGVTMINDNDADNDQSDSASFLTTTFQALAEQQTSHLSFEYDPMTSLDSFEVQLTNKGIGSNLASANHPSQDHFHYSAVANFPTTRDEPGSQFSDHQEASFKHDMPHSSDQDGLKSWFDREPITIFDPLHSPSPGSLLPQGFYDLQLAKDKTTTLNSGIALDYEASTQDSTTQMTPQSSSESNNSNTFTDSDFDSSILQEDGDIDNSAVPVDDDDSDILITIQKDDGSDDSAPHTDYDSDNSAAIEEDNDDIDSDDLAALDDDDDSDNGSNNSTVIDKEDDKAGDSATFNDEDDDSDDSAVTDKEDDDSGDSPTISDKDDDSATLDDDKDDSVMLDDEKDDSSDSIAFPDFTDIFRQTGQSSFPLFIITPIN